MPKRKLTLKQRAFIKETIETRNPTEAARRVYNIGSKGGKTDKNSIANTSLKDMLKNRLAEAKTDWKDNPAKAIMIAIKDTITTISENAISIVASVDNSFLGRQGLNTLMTHPTVWGDMAKKSFIDIYKTMASKHGGKEVRDALMAEAYSRPNFTNTHTEIDP